jgi:transcriptional regulator with XRE-family HTH domain
MPVTERVVDAGVRRGRELELMIGREIRRGRRMAGLSQNALGRVVNLSDSEIGRIERGEADWLSVRDASKILSAVGLKLWMQTYPLGSPLRDAGHLRLLADFEARLSPSVTPIREWPIPGSPGGRAVDLLLVGLPKRTGAEAETVVDDLQALERDVNLKKREADLERMFLVVRGSHRNRDIIRDSPALRRSLPATTRGILAALSTGRDPGADGIVLI